MIQRTLIFEDPTDVAAYARLHPNTRVLTLHSFLGDPTPPADEEAAVIDELRGALVAGPESIEHLLASLPDSPKNRRLASRLAEPTQTPATICLALTEAYRSGAADPPPGELVFVRAEQTALAFEELARACLASLVSLEDLEEAGLRPARAFQATASGALERLAATAERLGSGNSVVLFAGSGGERIWLDGRLAARGLDVPILPLRPFPTGGRIALAYAGDPWWSPRREPGLLSEAERDRLTAAGFPVRSLRGLREARARALSAWATRGLRRMFTSVDPALLSLQARRGRRRKPTGEAPFRGDWPALPCRPALSPTWLETYGRCPARAFLGGVARLAPRDVSEDALALAFGEAMHRALEAAGREGRLDAATIRARFREALGTRLPHISPGHPWREFLTARADAMAESVERMERTVAEALGPREIGALETKFELEIEGVIVRGKWDRVDRAPDGSTLVVDYKTGAVDFTPEALARGESPQALAYVLAAEASFEGPCAGMLFYDLKRGEAKRGLLRGDRLKPDAARHFTRGHAVKEERWNDLLTRGREAVATTAKRIAAGDFSPTPSAAECSGCHYGPLCRRRAGWV